MAKFSDERTVLVEVAGSTHRLTRERAARLRASLADALTETREFAHTIGRHRADGTYEVARRRADSGGNAKVFESFAALERRFAALPGEFTAADIDWEGVSAGRRHLLVRHLAEHPAFPCELVAQQPLAARKTDRDR